MDIQEIIKEKQKIEENLRKILIDFEGKTGVFVENINVYRASVARENSTLLSLKLNLVTK